VKPAPFRYHAPRSVDECLELLARYGAEAKVLAGGQSLMPILNFRLARPAALIDINHVTSLDHVALEDGVLRVGALARQRDLERHAEVAARVPLLREALALVGHPAIRSRGTVGGSIAHADPAAELPAALLCLEGMAVARSRGGERAIPAEELFRGPLTTALESDELLIEVQFRIPAAGAGSAILEVARRHGDFALVGAAAVVQLDAARRVQSLRLALFGVGPVPMRSPKAEALLVSAEPTPARVADFRRLVGDAVEPDGDLHATAEYRRRVACVLAERAVGLAVDRGRGKGGA
jgi:carbon-monoxide dehydrogenase medium subunit